VREYCREENLQKYLRLHNMVRVKALASSKRKPWGGAGTERLRGHKRRLVAASLSVS
jgi:hypothetical protein